MQENCIAEPKINSTLERSSIQGCFGKMKYFRKKKKKGKGSYLCLEVEGGGNWENKGWLLEGEADVEGTFTSSTQDWLISLSEIHSPTYHHINMMSSKMEVWQIITTQLNTEE